MMMKGGNGNTYFVPPPGAPRKIAGAVRAESRERESGEENCPWPICSHGLDTNAANAAAAAGAASKKDEHAAEIRFVSRTSRSFFDSTYF